jgi:hypothetical protein
VILDHLTRLDNLERKTKNSNCIELYFKCSALGGDVF